MHALIAIQHRPKWLTTLDKGVFIDFRKAFDLVDHNLLNTKLKSFNIPYCLLQWFEMDHIYRVVNSASKLIGMFPPGNH